MALLLLTACTGRGSGAIAFDPDGPAWPAMALLRTGVNPLWFELGPDGPLIIEYPAAATLTPYAPWPHARHITGMLLWNTTGEDSAGDDDSAAGENFLVMTVNRDGFIVLRPTAEIDPAVFGQEEAVDAVLYRVSGGGLWEPYTAESFFIWEDRPTVLLYQNEFFAVPSGQTLGSQVFFLDTSSPWPLAASIPVLQDLAPDWDAELLRRGRDGLWYYRMRERNRGDLEYYRSHEPMGTLQLVSVDAWRNSFNPGGRELYSAGIEPADRQLPLPPLPEGFSYTGLALLGNILVASWEEQQQAGIGAAGFMLVELE